MSEENGEEEGPNRKQAQGQSVFANKQAQKERKNRKSTDGVVMYILVTR
jgi:hypothetical protein